MIVSQTHTSKLNWLHYTTLAMFKNPCMGQQGLPIVFRTITHFPYMPRFIKSILCKEVTILLHIWQTFTELATVHRLSCHISIKNHIQWPVRKNKNQKNRFIYSWQNRALVSVNFTTLRQNKNLSQSDCILFIYQQCFWQLG